MRHFKNILSAILISLVLSLFASPLFAATDAFTSGFNPAEQNLDQGKLILFQGTIEGAGTLTSNQFSLSAYDHESLSTYPIMGSAKCNQANDSTVASFILQGSDFPDDDYAWAAIDTGAVADTAYTVFTLSVAHKYRAYRAVIKFTAATGHDATFKFALYLYQKRDEY